MFLLRIAGMACTYAGILFISNFYGADVYGRFSLSQTLLQFLILLFSLGLGTSTVKLTSDVSFFQFNKPLNQYLKNTTLLLLISSVVGMGILFLLKDWLAITVFKDVKLVGYFKYIGLFFVFVVFQEFLTEFIRGKSKFLQYGLFKYLLPPLLFIGFLVLFQQLEWEEDTIMLGYLLAFSILFLVLMFYFPVTRLGNRNPFGFNKLITLSFPMMFTAAFLFLSNWTDVFMLGAMVSKAEVGIYNAAYKLAIIALIVINAVNTVIAPKISELYSKQNFDGIKREVQKATKLITYATVPMVAVLILFRKPLLGFFGEEFIAGDTVLIIVSLGLLFNALSGSVNPVLNMTHHQNVLKKFALVGVVINVSLNFLLIPELGIEGAAIASLVSNMVLNIMCVIFIKREFNFYAFFIPWKQ